MADSRAYQEIPSRQATAVVFERLRAAILGGDIAAGSMLSQVQLARDFGVSRGPVREAIRLLEREGLVDSELNHRGRVRPFSPDDLEQLYASRIVLECLGLRLGVPLFTDGELATLDTSLTQMESLAGKDIDGWTELHDQFHTNLISHGGEYIQRQAQRLREHSERYRRVYLSGQARVWSTGASEHKAIMDACRARDETRAASDLALHLARTALTVLTIVTPEREPATVRAALRQVLRDGESLS